MTDAVWPRARGVELDREVERMCANVSAEQRAWLERHMWWGFPESFVSNRLMCNFKLDGTDEVPPEEFWWDAAAHFFKLITGQEPPGLVCVEPAHTPRAGPHFN